MPVVPGKPGSMRLRGTIRAQVRQCRQRCAAIVLYNAKISARTPPVDWLTDEQIDAFIATQQACTQLLNAKNA